jgi:hypothetical protein
MNYVLKGYDTYFTPSQSNSPIGEVKTSPETSLMYTAHIEMTVHKQFYLLGYNAV